MVAGEHWGLGVGGDHGEEPYGALDTRDTRVHDVGAV